MATVTANGIRLAYEDTGAGEPVLFVMGSNAAGRVWTMHQTPALNRAGYRTVTFDNRGIPPSEAPPGRYSFADMTADTVGLIRALGLGPCHVVGTSLGAMIAQELAAAQPDLVRSAVLIATRGRADAFRRALIEGERARTRAGVRIPAEEEAARTVLRMFSPKTLNDESAARMWLDVFELSQGGADPQGGQSWVDVAADRRARLREVSVPCRVIAFSDDLVCPPHLCAEVAEAIPDCDYVEIPDCGHLGFLEHPGEVNDAIIAFLDKQRGHVG